MAAGPSLQSLIKRLKADATVLSVLLGPEDGSFPTRSDEVDFLNVTRISRSLGAERLDSISMEWDLGLSRKRLVDTTTPVGHNRIVRVCAAESDMDEFGAIHVHQVLAWGVIAEEGQYLDAEREMIQVTTRIDPWLIGTSVSGYWLHHADDTRQFIEGDIVFNPEDSNDRIVGNMAGSERVVDALIDGMVDGKPGSAVKWWIDPGSFKTGPAIATQVDGPISQAKWTLANVVHSLCWLLNPDETYVKNPILADLTPIFAVDGVDANDLVRNLKVGVGEALPNVLDDVLAPYGFLWGLKHQKYLDSDTILGGTGIDRLNPKSEFVFVKKNEGKEAKFRMVRPGQYIDRVNTNVNDYWANISIADLTNRVEGMTSPIRVESTFELFCGFAVTTPLTSLSDLDKEAERANGTEMRLFVLNEAGDFNDLRTEIVKTVDLYSLLEQIDVEGNPRQIPTRRRKFEKCLTLTAQASDATNPVAVDRSPMGRNGYDLQFKRHIKEGDPEVEVEDDWKTVDWPFEVLDEMCGIRLTGKIPPELYRTVKDYPLEKPLRLTASIDSDFSVHKVATRQATSPNGLDVTTVLDLSSKFHVRKVNQASRFYAERHFSITEFLAPSSIMVPDMIGDKVPSSGDTITITNTQTNDGVYTVNAAMEGEVVVTDLLDAGVVILGAASIAVFTDEVDDTEDMLEHLERLRDADDAADVSCSLGMDRIDHGSFQLGDIVKEIKGRNLQLTGQSGGTRPLQIVGVNWEFGPARQHTEVLLDSSRAERVTFERET